MLSSEARSEIQALMAQYPRPRSAILPALYVAQREHGWLPPDVQAEIAEIFGLEPMEVYAIAGFYNMLYKKPHGKYHLEICTNVSCMLRGAEETAEALKEKLHINFGETTDDGNFTLIWSIKLYNIASRRKHMRNLQLIFRPGIFIITLTS
jgi:NADH:ubiquinone oxidoreductase subunit E